jgi:hypothetical protein
MALGLRRTMMGKKRHKPEEIVAREPEFGRRHLLALHDARSLSKYAGRLPASVVVCDRAWT